MTTKTKAAYAAMLLAIAAYEDAVAEEMATGGKSIRYQIALETSNAIGEQGFSTVVEGFKTFDDAKAELWNRMVAFTTEKQNAKNRQRGISEYDLPRLSIQWGDDEVGYSANYAFCYCRFASIRPVVVTDNEYNALKEYVVDFYGNVQ